MHNKLWWIGGAAALLIGALAVGVKIATTLSSPDVVLLVSSGKAQWITAREPIDLRALNEDQYPTWFRKRFSVDRNLGAASAILELDVLKTGRVLIDGKAVFDTSRDPAKWKTTYGGGFLSSSHRHRVDLTPYLKPGNHELEVGALNTRGPECVRAACEGLGIYTGPDWETCRDSTTWLPAVSVDAPRAPEIARQYPRADKAFLDVLPVLVPLFLVIFAASLLGHKFRERIPRLLLDVRTLRWALLGAWGVLAVNNITRIPPNLGCDVAGHLQYIGGIALEKRIPLPTEGWTTFQAPLYYILSAPLFAAFSALFSPAHTAQALRVIPLLCGMAQIEIAYRAVRRVWPERKDLQAVGMLIGGFFPMNLYMSQYVGNEPLAALTTSIVVLLALRYLCDPDREGIGNHAPTRHSRESGNPVRALWCRVRGLDSRFRGNDGEVAGKNGKNGDSNPFSPTHASEDVTDSPAKKGYCPHFFGAAILLGVALGFALLAKATAFMMIPPLIALIAYAIYSTPDSDRPRAQQLARSIFTVLLSAALVSGWYYLRNEILYGRLFFGGWEPERGAVWWQYPGYRTPQQFLTFGEALFHPMYVFIRSFWDGIYATLWMDAYQGGVIAFGQRPPWNYDFALSGVWLAFIPMTFMAAGVIAAACRPKRALLFALACLGIYFAGMLYGFLIVPMYCVVKATYTLGLLPCYVLDVAVAGAEPLARKPLPRALLYAALATWAIAAYCAYFVIDSPFFAAG